MGDNSRGIGVIRTGEFALSFGCALAALPFGADPVLMAIPLLLGWAFASAGVAMAPTLDKKAKTIWSIIFFACFVVEGSLLHLHSLPPAAPPKPIELPLTPPAAPPVTPPTTGVSKTAPSPKVQAPVEIPSPELLLPGQGRKLSRAAMISQLREMFPGRIIADATVKSLTDLYRGKMTMDAEKEIEPYMNNWLVLSGPLGDRAGHKGGQLSL
jgi:hypothetical protein